MPGLSLKGLAPTGLDWAPALLHLGSLPKSPARAHDVIGAAQHACVCTLRSQCAPKPPSRVTPSQVIRPKARSRAVAIMICSRAFSILTREPPSVRLSQISKRIAQTCFTRTPQLPFPTTPSFSPKHQPIPILARLWLPLPLSPVHSRHCCNDLLAKRKVAHTNHFCTRKGPLPSLGRCRDR